MPATIAIIDDDPQIREVLRIALGRAGFNTVEAIDGLAALSVVAQADLVILDIGLPEMDGLEVCQTLRRTSDVPVLFLTARDDEIDRILGLELGADDYVTKPFSPRELVARVKAILKRSQPRVSVSESQTRGVLTLFSATHRCTIAAQDVALTGTEMSLLTHLMQHPDNVVSRLQLIDALYGANIHVSERTVDSHLRNLRRKLSEAGCVDAIETLHGVGIRMGTCRGV